MIKGNKMVAPRNSLGNISRTKFANEYNFRTTFSAGYLFPIYASDVLPSEEKKISCAELIRSITPLGPTMDNSFIDIFFFFVPKRLVWDHWEEFIAGYNKEAWAQDIEYTVPKIKFKDLHASAVEGDYPSGVTQNSYLHSFLDYLPGACDVVELINWQYLQLTGADGLTEDAMNNVLAIDALYPRSYVKIWNDWFRDENLQDELQLYTGDNDEYADEFAFDLLDPTKLPKAAKYHNRFTDAKPQPQKGADVLIPMNNLPVTLNLPTGITSASSSIQGIGTVMPVGDSSSDKFGVSSISGSSGSTLMAKNVSNTIRMLNIAYQTEMFLAKDSHGGTRYIESILSHFKVSNGDARLQRSEYLGSMHIPLNVVQVTNTAGTDSSPLGNVGGQSITKDNSHYFTKAFTEHGIILGLAVVRTNLSYSSGVRKQYQRFTRFEHIWPEFKHIGDVPLYTKELFITPPMLLYPEHVFGYTPYASEVREGYNYNNGLFRAKANGNLSYLTYQEDYNVGAGEMPLLSAEWIEQPVDVVSNTLVDQVGPQFYALFSIHEERVVPIDPTSDFSLIGHF